MTFADAPGGPSSTKGGLRKGFLDAPKPKPVLKKTSSFDEPALPQAAEPARRRREEEALRQQEELARLAEGRQAAFSGNIIEHEVAAAPATGHGRAQNGVAAGGMPGRAGPGGQAGGRMQEGQAGQSAPAKRVSRFKQQRAGL